MEACFWHMRGSVVVGLIEYMKACSVNRRAVVAIYQGRRFD